jgi:hypothetical protein
MADLPTGAMETSREEKLNSSYDTDDDGPDARLRRRERREAKKIAAAQEKGDEDDETLLDESDTDDQERHMDQGENPRMEQHAPAPAPTQTAAPTPTPAPTAADPTPDPTPVPVAGTSAAVDPEAAQNTGTVTDTGTTQPDLEKQNKFKKPTVEINFVNCGSSANLYGAEDKLKEYLANRTGAGLAAPNPSGGASLIGQSESVNSSYRSVSALRKSSLTNPSIMQGGRVEREGNLVGSFAEKGDGRSALCHFRSVIEKKQNISTSFNPKTLTCSSCPTRGEHPVGGEGGERQCFVLSDQNFPGCVPVESGECLKIIRIENGMLDELVNVFLDLFKGKELPAGSAVVMFSATHLMMRGLSGYVLDMSREMGKLDRIFRGGILSVPGIPVFQSGCENRVVTMELIEFGEWAKTTGEPFPAQTWETLGSGIISDSFKGTFRQEKSKIPLPDMLRNSQRERSWNSGGWTSPCGVQPVGAELEKSLIGSLINELNSLYNLGLGTTTIHDRMIGGEHESPSRRYLFIGGSHAIKEGNAMADRGHEVIICAASGWRPNKTAVEELVIKVEEALRELTSNDVIVLHLYDNIAYMARSEEGGDLPIRQFVNGEFHVEGDLVIAGKDRLYMYFKNTLPLLRLLDGRRVVFLIPLPRYILTGCCEQEDHAPNRGDPGFEDSIRAGLIEVRGFFKDFLFSSNLRGFRLLNPGLCVPTFNAEGDPLWGEDDPVHPLYNGYEMIVDTILREADSLRPGGKRSGDDIAPAAKKPRVEVPRPRWIDQPQDNVLIHGGLSQRGGQNWFRPGFPGRGRFFRGGRFRGGRRN